MFKIIPVALFFLSFFASLVSNSIFRTLSKKTNLLIDKPDKDRKFHRDPTPLTGGLGISVGIIFSALFLFLMTDTNYSYDINLKNFLGNDQKILNNATKINLPYDQSDLNKFGTTEELLLSNGNKLSIKEVNSDSFVIVLPSGDIQFYKLQKIEDTDKYAYQVVNDYQRINNSIFLDNFSIGLIIFTLIVQVVMILDDLWGLSAIKRLFLQSLCVLGLIILSDVYITSLGNLFGFGEVNLGIFGIPFTIFCIVGIMNAFNMIDGLNGLCATLCLICFSSIIFMINANSIPSFFPLILPVGAITGFLMYNMGLLGKKRTVFLGDNGSNSLGFMCAWILVYFSSFKEINFAPITAVWLVAIPFMDAVSVMLSRSLKGEMPLKAGRDHIHHKLLKKGISEKNIYIIIILCSVALAGIGLLMNDLFLDNHFYSFYAFIFFWGCYYLFVKYFFKYV